MKLKTRLWIAFLVMIFVPLILTAVAFGLIGEAIRGQQIRFSVDPEAYLYFNDLIAPDFFISMAVAIAVILIFTALILSVWIYSSVFNPVQELNIAMKNIAEGNLDYQVRAPGEKQKGEMAELAVNYEDMRLRLKESIEEKLQRENQNKELISNISHDLKTPITAIKGYVEGIMDGIANTPEKMDKYIRTIYNKANDMDRLINELALYSGIDTNRIPYNFHRLNVADYFQDCLEDVGLDLESEDIELSYSNLVSPETMVIADPEQLKRVVNNIISNSVKYQDKKPGMIDIRILDEIDAIRIEIEDNGRGIAQRDLPKIFERFYRTDASRNSMKGGSGIGLSIVKKIVEDHGGYIWATSREGEGTCMHIVLRKYEEIKQDIKSVDIDEGVPEGGRKRKSDLTGGSGKAKNDGKAGMI
ncbi:MAG: HAMP domain-containing histidine kinase [Lachnospiraceae bacterium]|nr:HAMP domain-containing histidine kinase [Lachnospiraceae bacterium]